MTLKRFRTFFTILLMLCPFWGVTAQEVDVLVDTTAIKDVLEDAEQHIMTGELQQAREKIGRAEMWAKERSFTKGMQLAQLRLGDYYLNAQFFDSAKSVLEKVVQKKCLEKVVFF